jgi:hypothetical protein
MKRFGSILLAAGALFSLHASTFELYRDGAVYTFEPEGNFIGFVPKRSRVECGDRKPFLVPTAECPKENRLCREKATIERWALESDYAGQRMAYIDTLMKRAEVKIADPKAVLAMADEAGRTWSTMHKRKERADREVKWRREAFLKQAPSLQMQSLSHPCDKEVKLTLPGGYVSFELLYEADLSGGDRIDITRNIALRNRSGIDIEAEKAVFYYQPIHRTLRPIRFDPWVVRDRQVVRKRVMERMAMPITAEVADSVQFAKLEAEIPRTYRVEGLKLPSTGERILLPAGSWKVNAAREEVVFPYRDSRVYRTLRFTPPAPIEADRWRIREGEKTVASDVYGEYMEGRYTLFVSVDEDLVVNREPMILKEKESFFGGTVHKKDGYVIHLVNQSDEKRKLKVIDRIPVAVRSDVKVKLLSVECDKPLKKRVLEKGKLEMEVTLPPRSHADVRVLFEVSYDKEKPVVY